MCNAYFLAINFLALFFLGVVSSNICTDVNSEEQCLALCLCQWCNDTDTDTPLPPCHLRYFDPYHPENGMDLTYWRTFFDKQLIKYPYPDPYICNSTWKFIEYDQAQKCYAGAPLAQAFFALIIGVFAVFGLIFIINKAPKWAKHMAEHQKIHPNYAETYQAGISLFFLLYPIGMVFYAIFFAPMLVSFFQQLPVTFIIYDMKGVLIKASTSDRTIFFFGFGLLLLAESLLGLGLALGLFFFPGASYSFAVATALVIVIDIYISFKLTMKNPLTNAFTLCAIILGVGTILLTIFSIIYTEDVILSLKLGLGSIMCGACFSFCTDILAIHIPDPEKSEEKSSGGESGGMPNNSTGNPSTTTDVYYAMNPVNTRI